VSAASAEAVVPRAAPAPWRWITSDTAARYTARLLALAIWQLSGVIFERIPTPAGTLGFVVREFQDGALIYNTLVSLRRAAIALTIVLVLGVTIGIAMARWRPVRYFWGDLVMVGIALPAFIWALLGVMWWGFSNVAPIVVCVLSATPMLIVNTFEGAQATPATLKAMSNAYHVSTRKQVRSMIIPSMMEYIVAGFRFATLAGWGAVLLTEWFGNDKGAGFRAHFWYDAGSFEGMMGWGLIMMVVIMAIDRLVMERLLQRYRRFRVGSHEWSG
jgi:NitT/TauT family transport system permease protein